MVTGRVRHLNNASGRGPLGKGGRMYSVTPQRLALVPSAKDVSVFVVEANGRVAPLRNGQRAG